EMAGEAGDPAGVGGNGGGGGNAQAQGVNEAVSQRGHDAPPRGGKRKGQGENLSGRGETARRCRQRPPPVQQPQTGINETGSTQERKTPQTTAERFSSTVVNPTLPT